MLSIPEKVFLLSLYEKRNGSILFSRSPYLSFGLVAGSLMEIVISRVGALNSSRKVIITNPSTDKPFIPGDLIRQIQYENDPKKCSFWIEALGRKRKRIEAEFFNCLVDKKILILDGQTCHFHLEAVRIPSLKYKTKEDIRQQTIGGEKNCIENYSVVKIMSLIHMMDQIFTFDEIKPIHHLVDELKPPDQLDITANQTNEWIQVILESLNQVTNSLKD